MWQGQYPPPRNFDDDNTINKGRFVLIHKTPSEIQMFSNNLDDEML